MHSDTQAPRNPLTQFRALWGRSPLIGTGLVLLLMAICNVFAQGFDYPSFGQWFAAYLNNWVVIMRNNAVVGMIALGMTFVIISGGIDLAVGSTLVAVGTVVLTLIDTGASGVLGAVGITGVPAIALAVLAGVAVGTGAGALMGVGITRGRVPPFIMTLGAMQVLRSLAQQFTQGRPVPAAPALYKDISNAVVLGQRLLPIVFWVVLAAALYLVSRHTRYGRYVIAVGSGERTTRLSGINVNRVKVMTYALSGFVVSLAAIVESARMGSMNAATSGRSYELDAIAAVVVGGTRMSGGKGSVIGTFMGMLIIGVMNNLLNLLGVPPFLREAFKGAIVVLAVLLQRKEEGA